MDNLFVVAAGGTGAKVAEALVHLCAAGLGPAELHVLLVDGDISNGNRSRAEATADSYAKIQSWPWSVAVDPRTFSLFNSKITFYSLAERFDDPNRAGLLAQILGDDDLLGATSVLLDVRELKDSLSQGFAGRPNLGSLVMDQYLRTHFRNAPVAVPQGPTRPTAYDFIRNLISSAQIPESHPKIAIVGSVFGGTGASLLPVAKQCIERHFELDNATRALIANLHWSKIMVLPYFKPKKEPGMKNQPERHLMDTSSALWFYGLFTPETEVSEVTYLVGSETPEERKIGGVDGGGDQRNPAFFHEIVAALAILDFYANPLAVDRESTVRHWSSHQMQEQCTLSRLPNPFGSDRTEFLERLGTLFHLAAFACLATSTEEEFRMGLFQYAMNARLTGWNDVLHGEKISDALRPNDQSHPSHAALVYFGRLLLWAHTALSSADTGLRGLEFAADRVSYASLHNTLCEVEVSEASSENGSRELDHFTAHLCRTAVAGLLRENSGKIRHRFSIANSLVEGSEQIRVGLPRYWVAASLRHFGVMKVTEILTLCRDYGIDLPKEVRDFLT